MTLHKLHLFRQIVFLKMFFLFKITQTLVNRKTEIYLFDIDFVFMNVSLNFIIQVSTPYAPRSREDGLN